MRWMPVVVVAAAPFFFVGAALTGVAGCPQPAITVPDAGVIVDAGVDAPVSCADDEQCGEGFCRAGICVDEECQEKGQCRETEVCKDGRCVDPPAGCTSPADCPGAQLCDGFNDRCFDPNEGEGEGEGDEGEGEGEGEGDVGEGEGEGDVGEGEGEGEGEPGVGISLEGFRLENREQAIAQQITVLPDGIFLDVGDVLVIGRDASQAQFTTFWGSFGAGGTYLNAATNSGVPIINGAERFTLVGQGGAVVDGPARSGLEKKCYARTAQAAGADASWTEAPTTEATPGVATAPNVHGLVITEWCDAEGSNNFKFEFIEIANLP